MIANVLSIAGSDPSGGAGVQADLKTFSALGCYGMAAITALTAQNTRGVSGVHLPEPSFVAAQIDAIFADIRVDAVKIGMLGSGAIVEAVADRLLAHKARAIVVDPVLVATSGDSLGAPDVVSALRARLFPLARIITPNIPEALRLADLAPDTPVDDIAALTALAQKLRGAGGPAMLVKGGHMRDGRAYVAGSEAVDVLIDDKGVTLFRAPRVATRNTHGTGCSLSSAIAAGLGKGLTVRAAVSEAKEWLTGALAAADRLNVGSGHGPVHHFHALWPKDAQSHT